MFLEILQNSQENTCTWVSLHLETSKCFSFLSHSIRFVLTESVQSMSLLQNKHVSKKQILSRKPCLSKLKCRQFTYKTYNQYILIDICASKDMLDAKNVRYGGIFRGSEFSSYEIELRNRVAQNDVTLRVTNSNIFVEILLLSY